jgi:hypothetical protein
MEDQTDITAGGSSGAGSRRDATQASGGSSTYVTSGGATGRSGGSESSAGLTEHAKSTLSDAAAQAGNKVTSRLDEQKDRAAQGLGSVAQALRQTSDQLRGQDQGLDVHGYIASAADQVERFSGYLRSTDTRQMVRRVESFAREQPAVFLGSAFMLGLLAARFLRSSARDAAGQYGSAGRSEGYVSQGADSGRTYPLGTYSGTDPYGATGSSGSNPYGGTRLSSSSTPYGATSAPSGATSPSMGAGGYSGSPAAVTNPQRGSGSYAGSTAGAGGASRRPDGTPKDVIGRGSGER